MKIKILFLTFFLILKIEINAQIGGSSIYQFLNLTTSPRIAALGGEQIAIFDNDLNVAFHNPAMLNAEHHNWFNFNYLKYFADISVKNISFAQNFGKIGNIAFALHSVDYGTFTRTDEFGNIFGTFTCSDQSFNAIYSYQKDSIFSFGATLKYIRSNYENFSSQGIATDISAAYVSSDKLFSISLIFKNIGTTLTSYYENASNDLPFEIEMGLTKKLTHAPFRLCLTLRNLQKWNLTYENQNQAVKTNIFGETEPQKSKLEEEFDNTMRHVILGVEFLPLKSFSINIGYNHQRRKDLSVQDLRILTLGYSLGFNLKLTNWQFSYAYSNFHAAGGSHYFAAAVNLSNIFSKIRNKFTN